MLFQILIAATVPFVLTILLKPCMWGISDHKREDHSSSHICKSCKLLKYKAKK